MTNRTHLYVPVVDEAGDLLLYARVQIYLEDGVTPYHGTIYRDATSTRVYGSNFVAAPALVSVYFPRPIRVVLGIQADQSKPEVLTEVYDVTFDGAEAVTTVSALYIGGTSTPSALLGASDTQTGFWHPLRIDHEHQGVAPNTVLTGKTPRSLAQAGAFTGSTVLGAQSGDEFARSTLNDAVMLGLGTDGHGRGTVAAGKSALAAESPVAPWIDGAVALGREAVSESEGVALGASSDGALTVGSGSTLRGQQVAIGRQSLGTGPASVSLGPLTRASDGGIAIGARAGSTSNGAAGSIGLGAGTQYGLPGDADPTHSAVLLGAYDPAVRTSFSWANPDASQSESPLNEFTPTMSFAARTVQIQRHLQWVINAVALQVGGDATLGARNGLLGFYGATPRAKQTLGDDEPSSGIVALDNLIYALRDLGLIRYRTEAMVTYQASDMLPAYRTGDQVTRWAEHFGSDVAVPSGAANPRFREDDGSFNDYPSIVFENGIYRRSTKPVQELRGPNLLGEAKHYIVVGDHEGGSFGFYEGMFNLSGGESVIGDDTVFMSDTVGSRTWQTVNASRYTMDGLDQTGNRSAGLPDGHVYRMTNRTLWPHARAIIGGPRDQDDAANWDYFNGALAEIVGMDDSWDEFAVRSMNNGLMFKYGIRQDYWALEYPAKNFALLSHNPVAKAEVYWSDDYDDDDIERVYGNIYNINKPLVSTPYIMTYDQDNLYTTRDPIAGYWGNVPSPASDWEVQVSVFDWGGDHSRYDFDIKLDVPLVFDPAHEVEVGVFALNNNGTWSTGRFSTKYGHKVARIRNKATKAVLVRSGGFPTVYGDCEVRIYSTQPGGALLLEGTSPLWGLDPALGDTHGFGVRVQHEGKKVLRVYETSTGILLASTDRQEQALPRTIVMATDDPDYADRDRAYSYASALSVLVFCEADLRYRYRARHILETVRLVCNDDGSLNDYYLASLPAKTARPAGEMPSVRGAAMTILAILRYGTVTGDTQFLALATKLADYLLTLVAASGAAQGSILTGPGQTAASTADNAMAYCALRDLGLATGTASYTTAAQGVRTSLLANHWIAATQRFGQGAADDHEALEADVFGGLFLLAIGDRAKARATVRHLKRFRVKGAALSAPHYSGPAGLIGYKPFAELGTTPYVNPPALVDQAGSWLAILFKLRYGEPVGDDVASLLRWQNTSIQGPNSSGLFGAQFLSYSASASGAPWNIRARPNLTVAAWSFLMSKGGRTIMAPDPLPVPVPTGLVVTPTFDPATYRVVFRYTWTVDPTIPVSARESVPEFSIDAGGTWSPVPLASVSGTVEGLRDPSVGPNGFAANWSVPVPENRATQYRVRIRVRNAAFGPWITSAGVTLPPIT